MTEDRGPFASLAARLAAPVDVAWLAAFRILFGLTVCVSMLRFIGYDWIDRFWVAPDFHFKYWGFEWVEPLPGPLMHALFWVLAGLGAAIAAGFFFRIASVLFAIGFVYLQLIDVTTYLNHYYLAAILAVLLALSPAHRAWSLDALRTRDSVREIPALWLWLLRFQIGVVYTFAGLAKAHGDWLLHGQPLGIWLGSKTGMPVLGTLFGFEHAALVMGWAGFLFDTFIVWFLLFRRVRPFAYAVVLLFHATTRTLFPIGMFSTIMVLSALVFFPPEWPRAWVARGRRLFGRSESQASVAAHAAPLRFPRLATGAVAVFCLVQLLLPLRFLAYGGNVRWHEQGMRFSWRVMVREKNGSTTFVVRNKETGRTWHVSPNEYLNRLQEREMSGQPDLILQLAHHIRDDFDARGHGPVEVRADALVSLNGRPAQPLVDPTVDLASVQDGIAPASWILPAPEGPPPHLRPVASR